MRPLRASWLVSFAVAVVSFGAGFVIFSPMGKPRADGAAPAGTLSGMLAGRFSAASEDRLAALFAAFDEREPLRRDAAIFHAIEQLQPGDALGALGDLAVLIRRVEKLPRELWPHLAEAILERWLTLDADGALRWMEGALKLGTQCRNAREFFGWDPDTFFRTMEVLDRHQPDWAVRIALALPPDVALGAELLVDVVRSDVQGHELTIFDDKNGAKVSGNRHTPNSFAVARFQFIDRMWIEAWIERICTELWEYRVSRRPLLFVERV